TYAELPPEAWGIWEPQWSPAGDKIVFTLLRDGFEGNNARQYHIAWVAAEGGTPEFYSRTGREHSPQWSPDGAWLAYVSYEERVAGADYQSTAEPTQEPIVGQPTPSVTLLDEADLWMVSADGQTKYQLTGFRTGSVSMPRWSPDGLLLSFVHSPSPSNDTQWIIGKESGAIPTQLTFMWNLALDVTWQPDSAALVAVLRNFQDITENRLWRLPLVGNADTDAVQVLPDTPYTYADYPRFSADGTLLAFRSSYGVIVVATADGGEVWVNDANPGNTPPVWSPVGFTGEAGCAYLE
ncbi:MAG: PD40 domain-containing protein, partial [Armatimonadetes bacterium]|nr:PD40 domain-containing protein [Anaerolineae bacterium]